MKQILILIFLFTFNTGGFSQKFEKKFIIPYLCDDDKYAIADTSLHKYTDCIFDELLISKIGVSIAVINDQFHFVKQDGTLSTPVPDQKYSQDLKVKKYDQLIGDVQFFSIKKDKQLYIYNADLNEWYGPLEEIISKISPSLSYAGFFDTPRSFVFYRKGENLFIVSKTGKTKQIEYSETSTQTIKGSTFYYVDNSNSLIFNEDLDVIFEADSIIVAGFRNSFTTALKDGKRFKIKHHAMFDMDKNQMKEKVDLEEIPMSFKWEVAKHSYHEENGKRWIEDKEGEVFYSLSEDDFVMQFDGNILRMKGEERTLLLGEPKSKLTDPHISMIRVGKNKSKYLFQDENGYSVLDYKGEKFIDATFKDAQVVDGKLLWVSYQTSKNALLDENFDQLFKTKEKIVRKFIENTYVYREDSLYGLLDSLGNRMSPPLSSQPDFYFSPELEWIKIDQGKKAYLYNIYTKKRTEGLSNEFRYFDHETDENGGRLIRSFTYGVDSAYLYRNDGSLFKSFERSQLRHFYDERYRFTRKEITRNNYVLIDQMRTDTLLRCDNCDGMYMVDLSQDCNAEYVVCSYKTHKVLYDKKGKLLLPEGMTLTRNSSFRNELVFYPKLIVLKDNKVGYYNVETKKFILPAEYSFIERMSDDRLVVRDKGTSQIMDLDGKLVNDEKYYRIYGAKNGDLVAQYPMSGTHKKKVYRDPDDPNLDPCVGKIVDAPNYYYKIIDKEGNSRYDKKIVKYRYHSDDLINVAEWNGKDTIYYCMDLSGKKRKKHNTFYEYAPYHNDILVRKEDNISVFVGQNLKPKVDKGFTRIEKFDFNDKKTFYSGFDGENTFIYNDKFEEKAKAPGKYFMSRYGTTIMYVYYPDHEDIYLLDLEGNKLFEDKLQKAGYYNDSGFYRYKLRGKIVYMDMLRRRKFWD